MRTEMHLLSVIIVVTLSLTATSASAIRVYDANSTVSITVTPPGSGTVTLTPSGGSYPVNTNLFFKANPSPGYYFVGWGVSQPNSLPGDGGMYYYSWRNPANKTIWSAGVTLRLLAYFQPLNQWVRYSGNPILKKGSSSGWNPDFVYQPRLFTYPNGTFGMIFLGGCVTYSPCTRAVGLATSPDGLHWTQYPSQILSPSSNPSDWDSWAGGGRNSIGLGSVFWNGTRFMLYYSASDATSSNGLEGIPGFGLATSVDSIHWTKYPGNPVLTNVTEVAQASNCAGSSHWFRYPDVIKVGSTYMMFYNRGGGTRVATSTDGVSWSVQNGGCAVVYPADWDDPNSDINWPNLPHAYSWDGDFVYYASVRYDPVANNFKMFYSGCDVDCSIERSGFAVSPNAVGFSWKKFAGNPIISPMAGGFDNGDNTDAADMLLANGGMVVYYEADTSNSLACREGFDSDCNHFTTTSIGMARLSKVALTASVNPVGSGTATLTPSSGYVPGTTVQATANPASGYYFVAWALDGSWYGNNNPTSVIADYDHQLTAYFQRFTPWTKSAANPLLTPSPSSWDNRFVWMPHLFTYTNGTFGMVYGGQM